MERNINTLQATYRFDGLGDVIALKLLQPKRSVDINEVNIAYLPVDGVKCDIQCIEDNNPLTCYIPVDT